MVEKYIDALVCYGMNTGLCAPEDHYVVTNRILEVLHMDSYTPYEGEVPEDLEEILAGLLTYAVETGICDDNITAKDLFDTKLMGLLTPMPREVLKQFNDLYKLDPVAATDYYYKLSQDTDYIRRYRIVKDMRWKYASPYGELDITINLSKPEKDPKAIAAAKLAPQSGYPKCLLCAENAGYAGRMNHPARQNHRPLPITVDGADWFLQYSPYVYYNEHCIVFNGQHIPMKIDKGAFRKLLSFVSAFPHYFIGSNADLPIVGGSILSHEHFQGGHYTFAMATAPVDEKVEFVGFEDVSAGIVKWPMSVIRLECENPERIVELSDKILTAWRGYTDADAFVFAETDGEPHNTITPIARMVEGKFQMDLVLRNNITTEEFPLGVYHPHQDLHHIKKENIGLIEVMGLAVLPARLKTEMADLKDAILAGRDIASDEVLGKHADWVAELKTRHTFTAENTEGILLQEIGAVFTRVLEDAGVYKLTGEGRSAFRRFIANVNGK